MAQGFQEKARRRKLEEQKRQEEEAEENKLEVKKPDPTTKKSSSNLIGQAFLAKMEKEAAKMDIDQGTSEDEFDSDEDRKPKKKLAFGALLNTLKKKMTVGIEPGTEDEPEFGIEGGFSSLTQKLGLGFGKMLGKNQNTQSQGSLQNKLQASFG